MDIFSNHQWLPLLFAGLMGLAMLIYALLDGYDLGIGMLLKFATDSEKDHMVSSIGPFWDANETWLVLGVGLLLVAFPKAHGIILTNLYLPVALMLVGLILRGVAFNFRSKAKVAYKTTWNRIFFSGSLLAALSQGYMLGNYIVGFEKSLAAFVFSVSIGIFLAAGYCLIGASWLIMKSEGVLQQKAVSWGKGALWGTLLGVIFVSIATPWVSLRIFEKWFSMPNVILLAPIPIITTGLVIVLGAVLRQLPRPNDAWCWVPFLLTACIFILCFQGLAYSFYPYIVPNQLKIVEAASAHESLLVMLVGVIIVFPILIGYTFLAYRVFHGKSKELTYD